ncbi:MAG: hypothetical protein M1822_003687 [Bathelium mastoideum]|nr:MAG: hypothetical protein M1822_003687 [Bathelium mastoideum]
MAEDNLKSRLESHARAFDGLMSLMPAKNSQPEDNSDQWQRKKQTKEQKKAARKEKLKPENQKSAKDVMDENERKRKREMEQEVEQHSTSLDGPSKQNQKEPAEARKKQKVTRESELRHGSDATAMPNDENDESARRKAKAEKRKEKRKLKTEKAARKREKATAKKVRKQEEQLAEGSKTNHNNGEVEEDDDAQLDAGDVDMEAVDLVGITEGAEHESRSSVTPTPVPETPQSPAPHSASSSTSSIIPPSNVDPSETPQIKQSSATINPTSTSTSASQPDTAPKSPNDESSTSIPKPKKLPPAPEINAELLRARLKTRIDALRAARKADGPEGQPARTRQELLEQRRRKEDERKQRKKELRRQQKAAEAAATADLQASLDGSPNPARTTTTTTNDNNLAYNAIAFPDASTLAVRPSARPSAPKKKGPSDAGTALAALQHRQSRQAALPSPERALRASQDTWRTAARRAGGETVRDDPALLAKSVRRKEKAKARSAKAWAEREQAVERGKAEKQRKREENLRKRREGKGKGKAGGGKKVGAAGAGAGGGKKGGGKTKRPGFEGRFKS